MEITFLYVIIATFLVSLVSFVGALSFVMSSKNLKKAVILMVAFAAGGLLGGAFFHLIPESYESGFEYVGLLVVAGFLLFFLVERYLHWHHHHEKCEHDHSLSYLVLFGDSLHNFVDGIIIAASFLVEVRFGVITTVVVMAHEIPQEIGDFAILIYNGFSKGKALLFNFLSALPAVLGAMLGYIFSTQISGLSDIVVPFAAGGFIYIGASDLIPELNNSPSKGTIVFFLLGLIVMYLFSFLG